MCGARRRPPYCTKMTRDIGTCSNTPRITWFGQRHLTSTILYEDDPGYGNLQQCAADNLVRATPSDEHFV